MKQEPVAWMLNGKLHDCDPSDWAKDEYPDEDVIPLYTTPQYKELSDEEIIELFDSYEFSDEGVVEFSRAILKKATNG